ncbi:MAG: homoserine kinase [Minwuia sp.]|nr:homoserine kinase [Minwuia sp.]
MAVYTDIADDELDRLLDAYDIGQAVACTGIAEGVENSNFMLLTDRDRYILTLYEKRVDPADLPFFLGLLDHLSEQGFPCPQPIRTRTGQTLVEAAGRPAAIVSFLRGRWPRKPRPVHLAAIGDALARLHMAAGDFPLHRANALSLDGWSTLIGQSESGADSVLPGLSGELWREMASLRTDWPRDLPTGVIHADLFPDNVFFMGDDLSGVIDFYFACKDILLYDVAICLNAWCFERDGAFNITHARAMLQAYRNRRPISRAEFDALPLLARGAALRFLVTRLFDWLHTPEGAFVTRKDPLEYWHKLKFHRGVGDTRAYGLDF